MRRRSEAGTLPSQDTRAANGQVVTIQADAVNEQVVLAAAVADKRVLTGLAPRLPADRFMVPEHRVFWSGLLELHRQRLDYDPATLQKLVGEKLDMNYVAALCDARPEVPPNLEYHVDALAWDHARLTAATGPVASLVQAMQNPREDPARVKALARQVSMAFDGYQDRRFLRDSVELVRTQVDAIRSRMAGMALHPFGLPGLDMDGEGAARMVPGAAPGKCTVITGVSGSGKSTITGRIILGLARQRRRVLVGAWEMGSGMTIELLACLSLGYSRTAMMTGQLTEEHLQEVQRTMTAISRYVVFMENPFRREQRERRSNEQHLDMIQGYIADSGCDVFVADLWRRCLTDGDPEEEEFALYRQQAMLDDAKVHGILVQQQRLKDIETRPDKRPTREGIKGSSAWVEVADNIIGVHRPALWKNIDDNVLEVDVLKQRYGKWPIAIEFDWNADCGSLDNGRTVPYEGGVATEAAGGEGIFEPPRRQRRGGGRGRD